MTPQDSPVEQKRKELSRNYPPTPNFGGTRQAYYVFSQLQQAAEAMARTPYVRLSDEHVELMAIMGTGNEELMKAEMWRCRSRGFIE